MVSYQASEKRYATMRYRRSGHSGLLLPAISLGLWQNFGDVDPFERGEKMILQAFDCGINYFDLANNYGPSPGSAERNFGKIIARNLRPYRDEIVVATKAGYTMWEGPYGDWGSRKYLVASCDQSLKRMGLDYVDIFYHHRYDPQTPLEESMGALDYIVRSGRALYAALSNYPPGAFGAAVAILKRLGTPCVAHQIKYSMLVHRMGDSLFESQHREGVGCVSFSPLAQGLLSDKYLHGIPAGSRATFQGRSGTLNPDSVTQSLNQVRRLNEIALQRGQSLAEMAIAWQLYDDRVTSVLMGVSSGEQLTENLSALNNTSFTQKELEDIHSVLSNL